MCGRSSITSSLDDEIDRNYDAFVEALPDLLPTQCGKHALLRHANVIDLYDTTSLALAAGRSGFGDGFYSVQEVTDRPVDLGFYSH
jgi:hypothetical protein